MQDLNSEFRQTLLIKGLRNFQIISTICIIKEHVVGLFNDVGRVAPEVLLNNLGN